MKTGCACKLLYALLISILHQMFVSAMDDNAVVSAVFDVVPGGQELTHREQWRDLHCEFTYVCQGGTKEEWLMSISKDSEDHYTCSVERHATDRKPSYLFFESFELKVGGGRLLDGIFFGKDYDSLAEEKEYIVNHGKNSISQSADFNSKLHKVYAIFSKGKKVEL